MARPGAPASGFAVVPVSGGVVQVEADVAAAVTLDVEGWFAPSPEGAADGRVTSIEPARVLDTRVGTGSIDIGVTGQGGVPPAGVQAVVVELTASAAAGRGTVAAWPADRPQPQAAALGVAPGAAASSNLALVGVGAGGAITVRATTATRLAVDVLAWVTDATAPTVTEGLFVPLAAARVVDTRVGGGPLTPGLRRDVVIGSKGGLPPFGAQVALARVTTTRADGPGAVTIYPGGTLRPASATLQAGGTTPATAAAWLRLGQRGTLSMWSDVGANVTVDVAGYVVGRPAVPVPAVAPFAPDAQGSPRLAAFDAVIAQFMRADGVPGASVAVSVNGRVVYARAYGTADPATGAPVQVGSLFRYASMSKVITAAAVMNLVQAGRIGLDDPVFRVLARTVPLPVGADARLDQITVRDLLDHTSGLPSSPDVFFGEGGVAPHSCTDAARWVVTRGLVSNPGTRFSYVNMNFCILSLVVEAVTGEPYLTAVQQLVLEPRGVHDVVLGRTDVRLPGEVVSATGNPNVPGVGWFMESLLGAGGLLGTPTDLVRVLDGLDPGKGGEHLLAPEEYFSMLQPEPGGWGLGVRLFGAGSYGHTGSLAGARGMMVHQANGITWAITTNGTFGDHGSVLYGVMNRALATVPAWPAWDLSPDLP
jgi:CubicO group peptidase (beta-lactamase class C family)